jgi:hypothetical protein
VISYLVSHASWDVCVETAADEENAEVSNARVLDKALQ